MLPSNIPDQNLKTRLRDNWVRAKCLKDLGASWGNLHATQAGPGVSSPAIGQVSEANHMNPLNIVGPLSDICRTGT